MIIHLGSIFVQTEMWIINSDNINCSVKWCATMTERKNLNKSNTNLIFSNKISQVGREINYFPKLAVHNMYSLWHGLWRSFNQCVLYTKQFQLEATRILISISANVRSLGVGFTRLPGVKLGEVTPRLKSLWKPNILE